MEGSIIVEIARWQKHMQLQRFATARNTLIHQKYMTEKIYNNCNNVLLILNFHHLSNEPFQNITLDEKRFQYG